jgi:hypothetical protein
MSLHTAFVFGQLTFLPNDISKEKDDLPDKIKTIRQYKDDLLLNVREYDTLKNLIFSHYKQYVSEKWNGKYIIMITGNLYDNSGKVMKSFHLHSNAGLSIWYYEYDSVGNGTKLYMRDNNYEEHDSLVNTNPYYYISEIKNINDLVNLPKIIEIESVSKKYLMWEKTYDSKGNIITEVSYEENGDTSGYKRYEYDKNDNKIYFYNEWSNENHWEYYYEYEKNFSLFDEELEDNQEKCNLIQSVRVDYDWREERKRISDISFFKYDDVDRLIEKTKYDKGEFQDKYIYEYNTLNQVKKRISYVYNLDEMASEKIYFYNQEGNIVKEIDEDYRSGERIVTEYRYEYEYYK